MLPLSLATWFIGFLVWLILQAIATFDALLCGALIALNRIMRAACRRHPAPAARPGGLVRLVVETCHLSSPGLALVLATREIQH